MIEIAKLSSRVLRLFMIMVLLLGLALVPATLVSADVGLMIVDPATVVPNPSQIAQPAEYTISFVTHEDLAQSADDDVRIRFPADTLVPPGPYVNLSISINGVDVDVTVPVIPSIDVDINAATREYIIDVPQDFAAGLITVVFKFAVGLINPTVPGPYTLDVGTSREVVWVPSLPYDITPPPGPVDVYLKYQVEIADCGYIYFSYEDSFDTIQEGLDFADLLYLGPPGPWPLYTPPVAVAGPGPILLGAKVVVHDGTYPETIQIDTPGLIVESMNGAATTTIDAAGLAPQGTIMPGASAVVEITAGAVTFDGFTVINGGVGVAPGPWPDTDANGLADVNGIAIWPFGPKCVGLDIIELDLDGNVLGPIAPCPRGRINVLNNIVYDNQAAGIGANDCVLLADNNDVHDNRFDGFFGAMLRCGVECLDPDTITGGTQACTEITNNLGLRQSRDSERSQGMEQRGA